MCKRIMEETNIFNGGYGTPYDPLPAIKKLNTSYEEAVNELWENLYHQGDVGLASYAAVPALVYAGELLLVATIEVARNSDNNPELPAEFEETYKEALREALNFKPINEEQFLGYYIIHASVSGQSRLAKALNLLDIEEILNEYA